MPFLRSCLILAVCILSWTTHAKIYTWVDQSGVVNYSDQPAAGASVVKSPVNDKTTKKRPAKVPTNSPTANTDQIGNTEESSSETYTIEIVSPKNEETIRDNQGVLNIQILVKPQLKPQYKIQLSLDDIPIGEPGTSISYTLNNIVRGKHTLTAKILNPEGNSIAQSDVVTVFMMPPRVNMVRRPSAALKELKAPPSVEPRLIKSTPASL